MAPAKTDAAPLALTAGEPGGVGPELTVKAWRALSATGPAFFFLGDPEHLELFGAPVSKIATPFEASSVMATAVPVLSLRSRIKVTPGTADPANAPYVIQSIEHAVSLALSGDTGGVVTNPIQKASLLAAGFAFPGHTEFLGALTHNTPLSEGRARGPVMMLAGPDLKTVPVTVHVPLLKAVKTLTKQAIVHACRVVAEGLSSDFGITRPRLALCGVNPHAGEDGALGDEDRNIIAPAVAELSNAGLDVRGPLPADTLFHDEARATYDAAICMYHDQALIPVKTLAFHETVNVTLGLPIVRTSPDHGTALDIAGNDVARADSLIAAIRLAAGIAARRAGVA